VTENGLPEGQPAGSTSSPASAGRRWSLTRRLRLFVLCEDALLGGRIVGIGEHTLVVQLRELVQLRYPRRLVIRRRRRRRGRSGWPGRRSRLRGRRSSGAGRGRELLACWVHSELAPESLGLRHVLGLGNPARAERRGRAGHRTYVTKLSVADLKAPAAHRTDQVVVRPVGYDGHEVQAHRLLRPNVVEEHLVMTVRAHARCDLALVLRTAWPEPENHHHAAIETEAPAPRFTPCR
jgi:hypothetical protein